MNESLFIRDKQGNLLEGPLSDKPIKLLFVLKEPHGDALNCFWMREKVINRIEGTRYYNILGAFAKKILGKSHHDALEHSAYINLYPYSGKSNVVGGKYVIMKNIWAKGKLTDKEEKLKLELESILSNRLEIIKSALESNVCVVAHFEIVELLVQDERFKDKFKKTKEYPENAKYHIASYQYKGQKVKLYSIPHPADSVDYTYLEEEILSLPVYPEE